MKGRLSLAWGLMDALLLAAFVVFFVKPRASVPETYDLLAVVGIEVIAVVGAMLIGRGAKSRSLLKVLLLSFAMAFFLTYFLGGTMGFDQTFLIVAVLQAAGLFGAYVLTMEPGALARKERR